MFHNARWSNSAARSARSLHLSTCDQQAVRATLLVMDVDQSRQEREVERLSERLGELVRERQELRTAGADPGSLERNRLQIVDRQSEFGRALIEQHAAVLAT